MPTPVTTIGTEAANLALLINATRGGKVKVRRRMKWTSLVLSGVLTGHLEMDDDEIASVADLFGVTDKLMRTSRPRWSSAPAFNSLIVGFLDSLSFLDTESTVKYEGKNYQVTGPGIKALMMHFRGGRDDIPMMLVSDIASAIKVPPIAMNYLDPAILIDLMSIAKARDDYKDMEGKVVSSIDDLNAIAANLGGQIDLIPPGLPKDLLRIPFVRVIKDERG